MLNQRLFFLTAAILVALIAIAVDLPAASTPNCQGPCINIVSDPNDHSCGAFNEKIIYNHATQSATVQVLVTWYQNAVKQTRTDTREMAPNSRQILGCDGTSSSASSVTYGVQSVTWH